MTRPISVDQLSDQALLHETVRLAARERGATVELVSALVEIDARRLYLGVGCSSLFVYCTRVLHLSEHAAYGRIETARAARKFPQVLELLAEGALTLTAVTLLAPHLTSENATQVLASVRFKTKRDVEEVVATIRPRPDVVVSVRRLPPPRVEVTRAHALQAGRVTKEDAAAQRAAASPPTEPRQVVAPTAPQRYKVQLTIGRDTHDKLRRAQDLLRHSIPNGDPAEVFDRALTLLVEHLEKQKFAATKTGRQAGPSAAGSRHVPSAVRREVWTRDEGRCAFVGSGGRCSERGFLEFHHVVPYAAGGLADVANIQLRCRAHNAFETDRFFTCDAMRERSPDYGLNSVLDRVHVS